ncbi:Alg9-like mannosyltransferase family-domain-containing protein [Thamnocephalis sphaerospora]|uniref:Mannosyltransferase n=1 Tax=Thamnocephalis sphaerospora TaxID=78915 RepID=A0A4P9XX30_9FUNG|nr:Alg9-like mannosyltransferase family-domain-containing protein [Thamnocephalis sphaerospora]|eukprot:RKP10000.1 Alg9-like mannosyltransferase family-domain-containing protein [Thamnocephalis sphaerospora]
MLYWPNLQTQRRLLIGLVCLRLVNALYLQTYAYPDEHWQALEVAHRSAFGYGYLTWEWREGIRSVLHPSVFAGLYRLLDVLGLADTALLFMAPKLLQGLIAAVGDWYACRFARRTFGSKSVPWMFLFTAVSWCHWFHAPRTLANSMEAALSAAALFYWPWQAATKSLRIALFIAAAACLLRPTGAVLWLFLGVELLVRSSASRRWTICWNAAWILLGAMLLTDYAYYGRWVFVPYEFIHVNIVRGISAFYGHHQWHWYFTQGAPALLTSVTPLVVYGMWLAKPALRTPGYASFGLLMVYSMLAHKEFRFIYPVLPIGLAYAAHAAQAIWSWPLLQSRRSIRILCIAAIILPNLILGPLLTTVHQRGVINVMDWLRVQPTLRSVGYLMPCHSTPFWSRLHRRVPMWFLTCEPPASADELASYVDEGDQFYAAPATFLETRLNTTASVNVPKEPASTQQLDQYAMQRWWPSHLVMFDALRPTVEDMLEKRGYHECARFFNSFFNDDSRRVGDVIVYCATVNSPSDE